MESKNRTMIALVIAMVIAAAVLSSFFLPIIFRKTPSVVLPDVSSLIDSTDNPDGLNSSNGDNSYIRVEVTPETVQSVIATLERPVSYYRKLTVETIWGSGVEDRSETDIQVWTDAGFTKVESWLPNGLIQHYIVGDDTVYLWYGDNKSWYQIASDHLSADLAQRIPTYEDVLALEQSDITETGYVFLDDLSCSCIYVEVSDTLGYLERYWVEVQSGLLVSAETVKDGTVVYRMTSGTTDFPIPQDVSFSLPDGTVLHEVSKT